MLPHTDRICSSLNLARFIALSLQRPDSSSTGLIGGQCHGKSAEWFTSMFAVMRRTMRWSRYNENQIIEMLKYGQVGRSSREL